MASTTESSRANVRSTLAWPRKIGEIEFPEGVLIGMVQKGSKLVKPTGSLRIDEGDVITIFSMASDVPEVERLLQVSIDFF